MQKAGVGVLFAVFLSANVVFAQNQPCGGLAKLALPHVKIAVAQTVAAGDFVPPAGENASAFRDLPAFCRIAADATPSGDSDIKIEVWMPAYGWNGRFQGVGNGGFAGAISYDGMAAALRHGYATASTDTGHSGAMTYAGWALGHPEKITDFGYRAIHEMTLLAKATVAAFYGNKPQHSYFEGCSNGGRQALMEAQRYPEDYDGILAGAPANFWSHLLTGGLWDAQATTSDPASYIPSSKLPAIAAAVNSACDTQDGVTDGILNDPRECHFDPAALLCKSGDSEQCLTAAQAAALKKLYEGAHDKNGRIFPGFLPGGEDGQGGWGLWITGPAPGRGLLFAFTNAYFSDMIYDKPDWSYKAADLRQATKDADEKTSAIMNATDPDLERFKSHGGKLILYHGWNDPAISALNTIDYYDRILGKMGRQNSKSFLRLYMLPGVQHCGGGPGPVFSDERHAPGSADPQHSVQLALEQWVEKGVAPSKMIAAKYANPVPSATPTMTRPLCPYPQASKYKGSGDSNQAENFVCAARK